MRVKNARVKVRTFGIFFFAEYPVATPPMAVAAMLADADQHMIVTVAETETPANHDLLTAFTYSSIILEEL